MRQDLESRSLQALKAYVTGEAAEPDIFSHLKGIPRDEVQRVLKLHRRELDAIDPVRSMILESII